MQGLSAVGCIFRPASDGRYRHRTLEKTQCDRTFTTSLPARITVTCTEERIHDDIVLARVVFVRTARLGYEFPGTSGETPYVAEQMRPQAYPSPRKELEIFTQPNARCHRVCCNYAWALFEGVESLDTMSSTSTSGWIDTSHQLEVCSSGDDGDSYGY
jgi:hypothetical protein